MSKQLNIFIVTRQLNYLDIIVVMNFVRKSRNALVVAINRNALVQSLQKSRISVGMVPMMMSGQHFCQFQIEFGDAVDNLYSYKLIKRKKKRIRIFEIMND